ncbi:ArsR/SmtB family transcription factor [Streptococcus ratti]|uniref:Transcriptional regulator (ArsR family) protein n=1 Tax=Streptococcus ratti FA-1 = DSM 20564 TaxID=699248 RepID=A0ABP2QW09_STRRT|nr:metalloregulator ArsR/SmtB family transcription factor [Streptococcus ratti]EJN93254.1 putative transcriptional regulator (ArsR family) protein [Streptococcus ratti FA-1 = DSM 20564]EMP71346.1 putative ArsR family transcriptional regulator [Streptococcus ratti FA-1 = DSM 20564]QEY06788.1 winged helix-turn-helix transcriptional regulator [Streptococcus ratti]VEI59195.1 ArsR family transcriptional regulator [Streptococcus mutans]
MFDNELRVKILKALADQARLEIVRTLYVEDKEMGCGQISEGMGIGNSTISYHLKTLREAGLTYTRREGQNRYITLRKETFEKYLPGFLETLVKE